MVSTFLHWAYASIIASWYRATSARYAEDPAIPMLGKETSECLGVVETAKGKGRAAYQATDSVGGDLVFSWPRQEPSPCNEGNALRIRRGF
jgi:hypothetical protein